MMAPSAHQRPLTGVLTGCLRVCPLVVAQSAADYPLTGRLSTNGRQSTNADDLRPFFAAVAGLARLDGLLPADDAAPLTPATPDNQSCNFWPCDDNNRAQRDAERESLCAEATSVETDNRPTDAGTPTMGEGEGSRGGRVKNPSPQVNPIEIENFDLDLIPPTPTYAT